MLYRSRFFAALGIMVGMLLPPGTTGKSQTDDQGTSAFKTLDSALFTIGNSCGISTGQDAPSDLDRHRPAITLQISCGDIPSTLNRLLAQVPGYAWSMEDGVYDVYSKSEPDSVLNVRIAAYSLKEASLAEASDAIDKLPEFQDWLSRHHARRNEFYTGPRWPSKQRASLTLRDVSLRTVLNHVIRAYEVPRWSVGLWGDKLQYLAIRFNN